MTRAQCRSDIAGICAACGYIAMPEQLVGTSHYSNTGFVVLTGESEDRQEFSAGHTVVEYKPQIRLYIPPSARDVHPQAAIDETVETLTDALRSFGNAHGEYVAFAHGVGVSEPEYTETGAVVTVTPEIYFVQPLAE